MTMMKKNTVLLQLLVLLQIPISVLSTVLEMVSTPSCDGAFEVDSFGVDCGDGGCTFGSTVELSGSLSSNDGFSNQMQIKSQACLVSVICMTLVDSDGNSNMCDSLSSYDGQNYCPSAGSYTFSKEFTLPGNEDQSNWFYGYWIDVSAEFTGQNGDKTTCEMTVRAARSGQQMSYSAGFLLGALVILMAGATACGINQRRKRTPKIVLDDQSSAMDAPTSDFHRIASV